MESCSDLKLPHDLRFEHFCFFSTCWLQETVNDAKPPRREADFRGAKLLSSPSISASHHSAQRQSECELQAAALTNSTACYQTLLAACQYRLCLGLFSQLLAVAERLGRAGSLVQSAEGFVESLCMPASLLLDFQTKLTALQQISPPDKHKQTVKMLATISSPVR